MLGPAFVARPRPAAHAAAAPRQRCV